MSLTTEIWSEMKNGSIKLIDAIGADAKQQAALLLIGHRFFEQGKLSEARKIFSGLVVLQDNNPYIYGMLGAIFQKEQRHELALSCYNKSLDLFPQNINLLVNRGEIRLKLGRFAEAANDFKQSIELDPSQQHPAANRARLLVLLVQDAIALAEEKGISEFNKSRRMLPELKGVKHANHWQKFTVIAKCCLIRPGFSYSGYCSETSNLAAQGLSQIKDSFTSAGLNDTTLNPQSSVQTEAGFQSPVTYFNPVVSSLSEKFTAMNAVINDPKLRPEAAIGNFAGSLRDLNSKIGSLADSPCTQQGIIIIGGRFQPTPFPINPGDRQIETFQSQLKALPDMETTVQHSANLYQQLSSSTQRQPINV